MARHSNLLFLARVVGGIIGTLYLLSSLGAGTHALRHHLFRLESLFARLLFVVVVAAPVAGAAALAFAIKRHERERTPEVQGPNLEALENALLPSSAVRSTCLRDTNVFLKELWMVVWPVLASVVAFWIVYPFSGERIFWLATS